MTAQLDPSIEANSYHSFLVRLWQEYPHAPWRAAVQSVQTGETVGFADLQSLFAFLHAQTEAASDPPAAQA
jgi:hypothetical protein